MSKKSFLTPCKEVFTGRDLIRREDLGEDQRIDNWMQRLSSALQDSSTASSSFIVRKQMNYARLFVRQKT